MLPRRSSDSPPACETHPTVRAALKHVARLPRRATSTSPNPWYLCALHEANSIFGPSLAMKGHGMPFKLWYPAKGLSAMNQAKCLIYLGKTGQAQTVLHMPSSYESIGSSLKGSDFSETSHEGLRVR